MPWEVYVVILIITNISNLNSGEFIKRPDTSNISKDVNENVYHFFAPNVPSQSPLAIPNSPLPSPLFDTVSPSQSLLSDSPANDFSLLCDTVSPSQSLLSDSPANDFSLLFDTVSPSQSPLLDLVNTSDEEYSYDSGIEYEGEEIESLSMDDQEEIQNIQETNSQLMYQQLLSIMKQSTPNLEIPIDIDEYSAQEYKEFLLKIILNNNQAKKKEQITKHFLILEAKDSCFLSLKCVILFLKMLKVNKIVSIETEILRRSFATFNAFFKNLPYGNGWKVKKDSVEVPFEFVVNLWSEVISAKFSTEETNEFSSHPFRVDGSNLYLDVRCTWDGRTKVKWGK